MRSIGTGLVVFAVCAASDAAAERSSRAITGHVPPPPDRALNLVVSAGGGVTGFIGGTRDVADPGIAWNVRAAIGSMADVRLEVSYVGSSQRLGSGDGDLVGHGVNGVVRANFAPQYRFEPFAYAGAGWTRYRLTAGDGDLRSPDDVLELPFGVGVAWRFGRFMIDTRAGVEIVAAADLVPEHDPETSADAQSMHRFGIRANVGFEL